VAKVRALEAADNVGDIPSLVATLKAAGRGAQALEAYPMPKCADPKGYWHQFLVRLRAGADNASAGSGFGALLLAMGPLKPVPGIMRKLTAELKQNVGVSSAFASGNPPSTAPKAATRQITAAKACRLLNAAQAAYGMSGARGRRVLAYVEAHISAGGEGAAIKRAVAGELAHPPVHNTSAYNAEWVNDCMMA
jgi:hypothetical protein